MAYFCLRYLRFGCLFVVVDLYNLPFSFSLLTRKNERLHGNGNQQHSKKAKRNVQENEKTHDSHTAAGSTIPI